MDAMEEKYEGEIDFKLLCCKILYQWRKILLISLGFAILLGGYRYLSLNRLYNKTSEKKWENSYNKQLSSYNMNKEMIETEINNLKDSMKRQKDYNDNSLLMKINPYDVQQLYLHYYIDTNYKINPELNYQNIDHTSRIIRYYQSLAQSGELYNFVQDKLSFDIDQRYLKEILVVGVEYNNGMISVKVINNDKKACEEIIGLVKEYFNQSQTKINKLVGKHELKIIDESFSTAVDMDLEDKQESNLKLFSDYKSVLNEKQTTLDAFVQPANNNIITTNMKIKSTVKYTILGFVAGAVLVYIILLFSYLLSDKLISEKQVKRRYNLKVLGRLKKNEKHHFLFIDRWICRLEGNNTYLIKEEEEINRIAANIKAITKIKENQVYNVMFTGTIKNEIIEDIYNKVNAAINNKSFKLYYGGNISYNAETIEKIANCNYVVIIEDLKQSTYTEVSKELSNVNDLQKDVIGAVLI